MKTFKTYLLAQGKSKGSIASMSHTLYHYLSWLDGRKLHDSQVSYADLMNYISAHKALNYKATTIRHHIWVIRHYYNWQIKIGHIANNPAKTIRIQGIESQRLYKLLSKQDLDKLYARYEPVDGDLLRQRNKAILGLMIYQGLNSADLQHLKSDDLHLRAGKITIGACRQRNARTLTLDPSQMLDLVEYYYQTRPQLLLRYELQSDKLLIGKGSRFSNYPYRIFTELQGLEPKLTSFHQLRACIITYWIKNYNLRTVQYMAGHKYVSSTEAYKVNDWESLKNQLIKYHPK